MKRVLLALAVLAGCDSAEDKFEKAFLDACAEVYKERLRSPTSFAYAGTPRVQTQTFTYSFFQRETERFSFQPRTEEQHATAKLLRDIAYIRQEDADWMIATVEARYDADNTFGASIRGAFTCAAEYQGSDLPQAKADFSEVFVDGQTHMKWLLSQMGDN